MANGEGVTYTTKELISEIDHKLDRVLEKLDQKADKSFVDGLERRVEAIERTGSPQVRNIVARQHEIGERLALAEKEILSREHYVNEYLKDHDRIEKLEGRQLKLTGGIGVVAAMAAMLAATNALRLWLGIG